MLNIEIVKYFCEEIINFKLIICRIMLMEGNLIEIVYFFMNCKFGIV